MACRGVLELVRVVVIALVGFHSLWLAIVTCDGGDEEVLLALKRGVSDGSGVMSNWIPGTNYCNWTGIGCDAAAQETRVESIILSNRVLRGTITPLLGRLQYLRILNMELNNLTGSIPASLENCTRLTNISLGSNQLTGRIPENLDRLQGLQRLDLWDNRLEGPISASIGNCSRIDYLSLGQNFLTGFIPPELGKLSRLLILRIFTNNLVGPFPAFLTNCTRLQIISFRNNSLTGSIPPEVENWADLQQLRIQSNSFEGSLPPEIGNMTALYYIDISSNRLTGGIPETFGGLKNLQELYLNNNSLEGRIPERLLDCQSLGTINLAYNRLEGPLPEKLGDFQRLNNLTLDHNMIAGEIPESLGKLRLINLDLSHNKLSGALPNGLAGLTSLQLSLNLGYNSLSGPIPGWIGSFRVVQNISLQMNNFSGEIPASLARCAGLQSLDLSSNQLTGSIPSSLSSLEYLIEFNVSNNRLEGPVPADGPFRGFTSASFVNNLGLCGEALNKPCSTSSGNEGSDGVGAKTIVIAVSISGFSLLLILASVFLVFRHCYHPHGLEVDPLRETGAGAEASDAIGSPAGPLRVFTPEELKRMTEDFSESNLIGVGGFCRVYKGTVSKEYVAVKLLGIEMTRETRKSFIAELKTLGRVRHRNLVRLLGYCWGAEANALVLEFMPNGSLEQHLKAGDLLDWRTRFRIALGVAQGMVYLHHEFGTPVIHCDLKPANILLDLDFEPRVADFGISKIALGDDDVSVSAFRGSIGYTPPEYGSSAMVSTKGDVYSYGIVLLQLLTGKSPTSGMFGITSSLQAWVKNGVVSSDFLNVIDPELHTHHQAPELLEMRSVADLALECTSYNPSSRPQMQQVLSSLVKIAERDTRKKFRSIDTLLHSPSPYDVVPQW